MDPGPCVCVPQFRWLSTNKGWLLVVDNATMENLGVLHRYVPMAPPSFGVSGVHPGGSTGSLVPTGTCQLPDGLPLGIVLDQELDSDALAGDPMLPHTDSTVGSGHVLITTRLAEVDVVMSPALERCTEAVIRLEPLPEDEALAVLLSWREGARLSPGQVQLSAEDSAAARWLVSQEGLGGLPVALQLAGSFMREFGLSCTQYKQEFGEVAGQVSAGRSGWG
jgi:hypothetical protein